MKKLLRPLSPIVLSVFIQSASLAVTSLGGLTKEAMPARSPIITIGYLMQVFISLLVVIGLIYLTAKYILPKMQVTVKGRLIEVVDRIGLEPSVAAYILRVGKRSWLVAVGNKSVQLISELKESEEA
jgi:flagellar biogenesis protein FliO